MAYGSQVVCLGGEHGAKCAKFPKASSVIYHCRENAHRTVNRNVDWRSSRVRDGAFCLSTRRWLLSRHLTHTYTIRSIRFNTSISTFNGDVSENAVATTINRPFLEGLLQKYLCALIRWKLTCLDGWGRYWTRIYNLKFNCLCDGHI